MAETPNMKAPQPTVTSAALPKMPAPQPPVPRNELDESIEAKPLALLDFMDIEPANPLIVFRGVNHAVGDKQLNLRYEQCLAMGFEPAVAADVKDGKTHGWVLRNGRLFNGDLILMKISKARYFGALKHNREKAELRGSRGQTSKRGQNMIEEAARGITKNPELLRGVRPFMPTDDEMNKLGLLDNEK